MCGVIRTFNHGADLSVEMISDNFLHLSSIKLLIGQPELKLKHSVMRNSIKAFRIVIKCLVSQHSIDIRKIENNDSRGNQLN